MGYRSDVAILLYGEKDECDLVCNLFEQSTDDEGLRKMFNDYKQVFTNTDRTHYVLWCINDVKWYDDCQRAREKLFEFVYEVQNNSERSEKRIDLTVEFIRTGEDMDDNEHIGSYYHNYMLCIQRNIDIPNFNWTKGE